MEKVLAEVKIPGEVIQTSLGGDAEQALRDAERAVLQDGGDDNQEALDGALARLAAAVAARRRPHAAALARLDPLPGIGRRTGEVLLAALGPALPRFASARHLAAWAGMCPGHRERAGTRRSGKTRKGNRWLRAALVAAAPGAARTTGTYLAAPSRRRAARRGAPRAAAAVGHPLLTIAYHVLTEGTAYRDLGATSVDERDRAAVERRLVGRLEALGHRVVLAPRAPAAPPAPPRPGGAADLPAAV
jgi:transposase